MMRKFGCMVGSAMALAIWASPALSQSRALAKAETINATTLIEQFRRVVFFTEFGAGSSGKPLFRWMTPVIADINGGEAYRQNVQDLFRQLSRLTRLPFRIAADGKKANMEIFFLPTAEIRARLKQPKVRCAGQFQGLKHLGVIHAAQVYISTDSRSAALHCIAEEITQVLGLTNDTSLIRNSIFNDTSKLNKLSLFDQILVAALYSERLRPNMTEEQAMPVVRVLIRDLMAQARKQNRDRTKAKAKKK